MRFWILSYAYLAGSLPQLGFFIYAIEATIFLVLTTVVAAVSDLLIQKAHEFWNVISQEQGIFKFMEEGNAECAYVSIKESENVEERRSFIARFTCFGLVLATLVVIGLYSSALLRDKVEKVAVSLEDVRPAEVDADAAIPRSRGPAQGVSEKSVGVSLKPYTWSNAALQWQRSAYHFQPEKNWMNDPNGPLFYKGWYHLFYQYNPDSAIWGNIAWGHAVSQDLVHWKYLDLAMVPDQWYDINGVWTGSATILSNGSIFMLYTGSTNGSVQVQNLAWPADPQDELLRDWEKTPANPVLVPPHGIGLKDFRDPTTGWTGPDGAWRIAIGSRLGTTGICLVYSTSDFLSYELLGSMHGVPDTGMWECVDFYPVAVQGRQVGLDTSANGQGIKHVLKASLDDTKNDHYALGTYDAVGNVFRPDDPAIDVGIGLRYDYGNYYAAKTFYDPVKKRRVLWGWVSETDSEHTDLLKGWACLQTVPRTVLLDSKTKSNLIQWPVEELDALRFDEKSWQNIALSPGSVIPLEVSDASQLDVELEIQFPEAEEEEEELQLDDIYDCSSSGGASRRGVLGPFGLLVLADEGLTEQTAVYFYITKDRDGKLRTLFCHDLSRSSLASDVLLAINGSSVPVLADENSLTLRTLIDHSIVESFAQGGRTCITSRIYPTQAINGAARLHLFNNATRAVTVSSLKVWQMQSAGIHRYND